MVNRAEYVKGPQAGASSTTRDFERVRRLVEYGAGKIRAQYGLSVDDYDDLKQVGYIAGLDALKRFDPAKGKLSTWVLKRANGAMRDAAKRLRSDGITGGLMPLRIDPSTAVYCDDSDDPDVPGSAMGACIEALESVADEQLCDILCQSERKRLQAAVERLPTKWRDLLTKYYGLSGERPRSSRELATEYRMSKSRIGQLLEEAVTRARGLYMKAI